MWDENGLDSLRQMNDATLDVDLVLRRGGVNLPSQKAALQLIAQQSNQEGEAITTPGATMRIRGAFNLDIRGGDVFSWDGQTWKVDQKAIATGTNTSVARRATAHIEGGA